MGENSGQISSVYNYTGPTFPLQFSLACFARSEGDQDTKRLGKACFAVEVEVHHETDELQIVDDPIPVDISNIYQIVNLGGGKLLGARFQEQKWKYIVFRSNKVT